MTLHLRLFGRFEITQDGAPLATGGWTYKRSHHLLKLLALQPNLQIHKEQAIDLFWPAIPAETAAASLYRTLHYLRRALEPDLDRAAQSRYITLRGGLIRLELGADGWVDVRAFDELFRRAQVETSPVALLEQAVALHRGPLLYDDLYEEWTQIPRSRYQERYVEALHSLVQHYRAAGAHKQLVEAARQLLAIDASDEAVHRELMRSYMALGRRGEALRQYEQLARSLRAELGVEPSSETTALYEQIWRGSYSAPAPAPSPPPAPIADESQLASNLPAPLTLLLGREAERAELGATLARPGVRLLTLTGVAGVGKTSLALQVAREARPGFPDGVFLIDLAPLADGDMILPAIVAALGLSEQPSLPHLEALRRHLGERRVLLLLDNFEHLFDAADQVVGLLAAAPGLKVLVTSRRTLNLSGEHIYVVPPLALPDGAAPSLEALARVPSVALFVARAHAAQQSFALADGNAAVVAEICRRLDGLPLAIELAAARVRLMPAPALLAQLGRRLDGLSQGPRDVSGRHSSLRSALDWSFQLLSPAARRCFAHLAVFVGGFTAQLARHVCADDAPPTADFDPEGPADPATLTILGELVDNQLITPDASAPDTPRYRMLETLREYAAEQLELLGETRERRARHAAALAAMVTALQPRVRVSAQVITALDREIDNLRAALRWMTDHGPLAEGLATANRLGNYWYIRSLSREGRQWLELFLAQEDPAGAVPMALRASALNNCATYAARQGDHRPAAVLFAESLDLSRQLGDEELSAKLLCNIGLLAIYEGDYARAEAILHETAELSRRLGNTGNLRIIYGNLGVAYEEQGELQQARAMYEAALALLDRERDPYNAAIQLGNIAGVLIMLGEPVQARPYALQALELYSELRSVAGVAVALGKLALASGRRDREIVRLLGAAAALGEAAGEIDVLPVPRRWFQVFLDGLRAELGPAFEAAWAEGRAIGLDEAVAAARTAQAL